MGLVVLFDLETLVPLAIMPDGYLQRMRVGATSALAARALAPEEPELVGMIGTGWQAGAQLLGLHAVWRDIREFRVFSPDTARREAFCREHEEMTGIEVRPVATAREAVEGLPVVALATNAQQPVLDGGWLQAGQHVGSVQGHELGWDTLERADRIVVRSFEPATHHHAPGHAPREAAERKKLPEHLAAKLVELGDVVVGRAGRTDPGEVTLFTGGGTGASSGLGIQFTAVAHSVYRAARAQRRGRELPVEWFTQPDKP